MEKKESTKRMDGVPTAAMRRRCSGMRVAIANSPGSGNSALLE
jgi:hypothetical protein